MPKQQLSHQSVPSVGCVYARSPAGLFGRQTHRHNTVPERCTVEIDRRLVPGEQPSDAYQHAIHFLAATPDTEAVHEPPYMQAAGLTDTANSAVAVRLLQLGVPGCTKTYPA